jgi:2-keto-4-pentenoate hydratase
VTSDEHRDEHSDTDPYSGDLEAVWDGITSHIVDVSRTTPDLSVSAGEAVQLAVLERLVAQGARRGGWKVGMTSGVGRDSVGVGVRPFGYLLESRILSSGERLDASDIRSVGLETELCFRLGATLGGSRASADDARRAVDGVAPAFEVNEERLDAAAANGVKVADNLRQWAIVAGEFSPVPDADLLGALVSTISLDGHELQRRAAEGHIDDHFESLAALARELAAFDLTLDPGDVVITGAFTRIGKLAPGHYVGAFSGLGEVALELA